MDTFTLTVCPHFALIYPIASGSTTGKPKNKEVPLLPGHVKEEEGGSDIQFRIFSSRDENCDRFSISSRNSGVSSPSSGSFGGNAMAMPFAAHLEDVLSELGLY